MSLMRSKTTQPGETDSAAEPLPLFRPEALSKQDRFFGEVLRIRPVSFAFLVSLVIGIAAVTCGVLFFGSYTEPPPVRRVLPRGATLKTSRFTPEGRRRPLFELFEPSSVRGKSQP